jgi:hypothetical protein
MFKSSKSSLITAVLALTALVLIGYGCEKQAKTGTQEIKTTPKASIAGDAKTGCAGKAADEKSSKTCKVKEKKGWYAKKEKSAADANAPKGCLMKDKKACPKDCKKPCCAKKACHAKAEKKCSAEMAKKCAADPNAMKNCPMKDKKACPKECKAADANVPAKQ